MAEVVASSETKQKAIDEASGDGANGQRSGVFVTGSGFLPATSNPAPPPVAPPPVAQKQGGGCCRKGTKTAKVTYAPGSDPSGDDDW